MLGNWFLLTTSPHPGTPHPTLPREGGGLLTPSSLAGALAAKPMGFRIFKGEGFFTPSSLAGALAVKPMGFRIFKGEGFFLPPSLRGRAGGGGVARCNASTSERP